MEKKDETRKGELSKMEKEGLVELVMNLEDRIKGMEYDAENLRKWWHTEEHEVSKLKKRFGVMMNMLESWEEK